MVLDISEPGNWGVYPYFPSGNVALSDVDSGFYMVADCCPSVTLSNANSDTATFQAPTVSSDTFLRFELHVTDIGGLDDTSIASVTVSSTTNSSGGNDGGAIGLWMLLGLFGLRVLNRKGAS
jgi:hypothetical protein